MMMSNSTGLCFPQDMVVVMVVERGGWETKELAVNTLEHLVPE